MHKTTPYHLAHGKPPNLAKLMSFGQNVEAYVHKSYSKLCTMYQAWTFCWNRQAHFSTSGVL